MIAYFCTPLAYKDDNPLESLPGEQQAEPKHTDNELDRVEVFMPSLNIWTPHFYRTFSLPASGPLPPQSVWTSLHPSIWTSPSDHVDLSPSDHLDPCSLIFFTPLPRIVRTPVPLNFLTPLLSIYWSPLLNFWTHLPPHLWTPLPLSLRSFHPRFP